MVEDWYNLRNGWGYAEFVSVAQLTKAYLDKEGSLNVEIEFDVVSETKYSFKRPQGGGRAW
ncbi:unnamed protein product [Thlaspi arvense]|uniref:Uncharacterized protein n=1 Tax=Thlaspi arvense TaxID=13288 RepID=A0AAU9RWY0_THLAR|nr:unnamed protein product [Thlaspi arvense]